MEIQREGSNETAQFSAEIYSIPYAKGFAGAKKCDLHLPVTALWLWPGKSKGIQAYLLKAAINRFKCSGLS